MRELRISIWESWSYLSERVENIYLREGIWIMYVFHWPRTYRLIMAKIWKIMANRYSEHKMILSYWAGGQLGNRLARSCFRVVRLSSWESWGYLSERVEDIYLTTEPDKVRGLSMGWQAMHGRPPYRVYSMYSICAYNHLTHTHAQAAAALFSFNRKDDSMTLSPLGAHFSPVFGRDEGRGAEGIGGGGGGGANCYNLYRQGRIRRFLLLAISVLLFPARWCTCRKDWQKNLFIILQKCQEHHP